MILALAGLAAALQSAAPAEPPPYDHLAPKEMRKVIEACGFARVWVGRDKREILLVRVEDSSASDEQLICAAKAIDTTFYTHEFSPELAPRFAPIRAAVARPRQLAEARARFAKEPERGPPPERLPGESSLAVAKRIEAFCGAVAEGALVQSGDHIMLSGEWMARRFSTVDAMIVNAGTMGCLMQASVIADLQLSGPVED
ncbi:MAG: hypothetical protein C0471_12200 [Erythrobacter sp.]|nr:hypothetical protein [Erythrobacter sp.]